MQDENVFTSLRKKIESHEHIDRSMSDSNLHNDQGYLRICNVLHDFIYFDFWTFFLLLTPFYAFKTMGYVVDRGIIYVAPYVAAFAMIYFKSFVYVKDWVVNKWFDYRDF